MHLSQEGIQVFLVRMTHEKPEKTDAQDAAFLPKGSCRIVQKWHEVLACGFSVTIEPVAPVQAYVLEIWSCGARIGLLKHVVLYNKASLPHRRCHYIHA